METKEGLKRALMQEAEAGVLKLLEHLPTVKEGELKGLEQQVMETIFEIGRGGMESSHSEAAPEEEAPGQRVGSCGHQQQLVGYRPKQVLTLVGKITFKRAYYQCVVEEERAEASMKEVCRHGEAPADGLWGVQGRRTRAGVRASGELSVRLLDAGGSRCHLQSVAPLTDVGAPSTQLTAAPRRSPPTTGR